MICLFQTGGFQISTNHSVDRHVIINLTIFTVLIIALPLLGRWLASASGNDPSQDIGLLIWIASPIIISFALRAFAGDGWKDLGIRPALKRNWMWYAFSILVYPVIISSLLLTGRFFNVLAFSGLNSENGDLLVKIFLLALLSGFIKNIFEEFSWRGYLAPKMYKLGINDLIGHVIVGLIWGAWHFTYFSFAMSYLTESPVTLVPRFLLGAVAASLVYGEIRIATGSVWPAVLMHTVGGAIAGTLYFQNIIKISAGMEFLVSPGIEGLLSIVLFIAAGAGLYLRRKKREKVSQT